MNLSKLFSIYSCQSVSLLTTLPCVCVTY